MNRPSLSARRAWIEIQPPPLRRPSPWSLSARRAWIEMYYGDDLTFSDGGRSPQGERG